MKNNYTCAICKKQHDSLDAYMKCVSSCYEKVQQVKEAEKLRKQMEEINSYVKDIKDLKKKLERLEDEFCRKYPKEYALNFGEVTYDETKCDADCDVCAHCESCGDSEHDCEEVDCLTSLEDVLNNTIKVSVTKDGKNKKLKATVNGREVGSSELKNLKNNPEIGFLMDMLGI